MFYLGVFCTKMYSRSIRVRAETVKLSVLRTVYMVKEKGNCEVPSHPLSTAKKRSPENIHQWALMPFLMPAI